MSDFAAILGELGQPKAAKLAQPDVASLFGSYVAPAEFFGYPPALIPIFSEFGLPSYLGLWKHWFVQREPSFVTMDVRRDHLVEEVARNESQLAARIVLELMVLNDGVDAEVRGLANLLNVGEFALRQIDKFSDAYGDDYKELAKLPDFRSVTPRECADPNLYGGEFPTPKRLDFERQCYFEFDPDLLAEISDLPPWLDPTSDKPPLFRQFVNAGDYAHAWLTLNGTGWFFDDAAKAMARLKSDLPDDRIFQQVAECWIANATGLGRAGY